MQHDVLIVGAGPTGLVLALWLRKFGVDVRVVDRTSHSGTTSRALAVQARTLELYAQLGLADEVVARGHKVPAANLWVKGHAAARISFESIGAGLTPYPFLHIFPQDEHEQLLIDRLAAAGVEVERNTELVGFTDEGEGVAAELRGPDGRTTSCFTRYLAGCDGARSSVRDILATGFGGGTYRQIFYVADVDASGPAVNGELHIDLDEADFLAVFPLAGKGRARLIGTVRDERADHPDALRFEDVSDRAIRHMAVDVRTVNWFSTYRVHHRVAAQFRHGRVFLLGDAAHIHSPAGGQGMNTGIGDAINLAWKLAAVLKAHARDALLDSYEAERIGFARRLVSTTDRVFDFATADGVVADVVRTRIAPIVLSNALSFEAVRNFIFRTVSQITVNYRRGPLSAGDAGRVHGGDRMPWVRDGAADNFQPLADARWQVHVYGTARDDLRAWCDKQSVPLHAFAWHDGCTDAGLARDALYLVRPDCYVALAEPSADPTAIERYGNDRALRFGSL